MSQIAMPLLPGPTEQTCGADVNPTCGINKPTLDLQNVRPPEN